MASKQRVCRFCGEQKALVRAHIIPEAFFRAMGKGKDAPILISDRASMPFPKRLPIGPYDSNILCDSCERKFDKPDAYGTKTLLHTLHGTALMPLIRGSEVVGFEASGIDQALLLRFFVATLWRASVSDHPVFERVVLGERYEKLAKEALTASSVSSDFGAVLAVFKDAKGGDESIGLMDPIRQRYDGVNIYRFFFGPYHAHIKVDQRPFSGVVGIAALGSNSLLRIVRRDFRRSKDFRSLKRTAIRQDQKARLAKQSK